MADSSFHVFDLDCFDWVDALDFFRLPHPSNDQVYGDSGVFHFRIRHLDESPIGNGDFVVLWENREEPTDEELLAALEDYYGSDDEEDGGE